MILSISHLIPVPSGPQWEVRAHFNHSGSHYSPKLSHPMRRKGWVQYLLGCIGHSGSSCGIQNLPCIMQNLSLRHMDPLVAASGLSNCNARAQLLQDMWNLSSLTRERTCTARGTLNHWIPREAPLVLLCLGFPSLVFLFPSLQSPSQTQHTLVNRCLLQTV